MMVLGASATTKASPESAFVANRTPCCSMPRPPLGLVGTVTVGQAQPPGERHLLAFGAEESCGKCVPCRIGLQRGLEMVEREGPVDRDKLEALLETLELGSLCAHGGGMPAPIRSLIAHFPDELGMS
jgi:hypothetical protein